MGIVHGFCFGLLAEVVDHAVHGVLVAQELHCGAFTVEELEGLFAEVGDTPALGFLHGDVLQELRRLADAVHAEGGDLLMLVGPAHHVIAVAVPGQGVGAENIRLAVVLGAFPLGCRPGEVEEGNLPSLVDGPVNHVDVFVDMLVFRLDPIRQRDIALQLSRLVDVGHGCQLVRQDLTFGGSDELGGGHCVDQQL